ASAEGPRIGADRPRLPALRRCLPRLVRRPRPSVGCRSPAAAHGLAASHDVASLRAAGFSRVVLERAPPTGSVVALDGSLPPVGPRPAGIRQKRLILSMRWMASTRRTVPDFERITSDCV